MADENNSVGVLGLYIFVIPFTIGFFGLLYWGFSWDIHVFTGSVLALLISLWGYKRTEKYEKELEQKQEKVKHD